jgi:hypothetical protein
MITRITRGRVRTNAEGIAVARLREAIIQSPSPAGLIHFSLSRTTLRDSVELVAITIWTDADSMARALGPNWQAAAWSPSIVELMEDSSTEMLETVVDSLDDLAAT